MADLTDRFQLVCQQIDEAMARHHRAPGSVQLLAVSKTRPADDIAALHALGQSAFGESYLQESLAKLEALAERNIDWHFIGPLQSNKTRPVAEHFDWLHSVDRLKLASRLSDQRPAEINPLQLCLQVNISGEASKSGCQPEQLPALAEAVVELPGLKLRGLMALPAPNGDFDSQRRDFAAVRRLFEDLRQRGHALDTLSMGMSGDLEAAIAEGATIVRIGTALFGPRPKVV